MSSTSIEQSHTLDGTSCGAVVLMPAMNHHQNHTLYKRQAPSTIPPNHRRGCSSECADLHPGLKLAIDLLLLSARRGSID